MLKKRGSREIFLSFSNQCCTCFGTLAHSACQQCLRRRKQYQKMDKCLYIYDANFHNTIQYKFLAYQQNTIPSGYIQYKTMTYFKLVRYIKPQAQSAVETPSITNTFTHVLTYMYRSGMGQIKMHMSLQPSVSCVTKLITTFLRDS